MAIIIPERLTDGKFIFKDLPPDTPLHGEGGRFQPSGVSLALYDIIGAPIAVISEARFHPPGQDIEHFSANSLKLVPGNCFHEPTSPLNTETRKLVTDLPLEENHLLPDLAGLNQIAAIGGDLIISHMNLLECLSGLENVNSFTGNYLEIIHNPALTSLSRLDGLNSGSISGLNLYDNYLLSFCAIPCICNYLSAQTGILEIHNNAIGGDNRQHVELACESVSAGEIQDRTFPFIYPNPSSSVIIIETPDAHAQCRLSVSTLRDQPVITRPVTGVKTRVDISILPAGLYIVQLTGETTVQAGILIKQ